MYSCHRGPYRFLRCRSCFPFKDISVSLHSYPIARLGEAKAIFAANNHQTTEFSSFNDEGSAAAADRRLFSNLLSKCCRAKAVAPGMQVHALVSKHGFSFDHKLRNQLVTLYSKSRRFDYAINIIDGIHSPDLISCSALISGYTQNGLGDEALRSFRDLHFIGVKCNEFAFSSALKASFDLEDLRSGTQIHALAIITGYEFDVYVANTIAVMYAKCGEFYEARKLFSNIPERTVVSWNALFSCYSQVGLYDESLNLFHDMVFSGIKPNEFSLSSMVNACTGLGDGFLGRMMHCCIIKLGYQSDSFSANALVDMYAKVGSLLDAVAVFEEISEPDIVSWNAIISGCVYHERNELALEFLVRMNQSRANLNMFTVSSGLKACAGLGKKDVGMQLHSFLVKANMKIDVFVTVGLIDMYFKCGLVQRAKTVYDLMQVKDLVSSNAMVSGYSQNGEDVEAVILFGNNYTEGLGFNSTTLSAMLKSSASLRDVMICLQVHTICVKSGYVYDHCVGNGLIDSYSKCSLFKDAVRIFEKGNGFDVMSLTSMIACYAQCGEGENALRLFLEMKEMEVEADDFVLSSVLNACASLSAYEQGRQVHVDMMKLGFVYDAFAGNSLVNMYAKCGSIDEANSAFEEIPCRGVISWSAMIGGLAHHGHGKEAVKLFQHMMKEGVRPNHVTLVSVLSACSHAGLLEEGKHYFESMKELFGIEPLQEHYTCMIDLLGRSGKLGEAVKMVESMPFEANAFVWGSLLGASRIHKNIEVGRRAAAMLFRIEPENSGTHILLANIYASSGMWKDVAELRKFMRGKTKKEPGVSWVEVRDKVHTFVVGDRSHERSEEIYMKLDELSEQMARAGYIPAVEIDLHDVDRSDKAALLLQHSEKLAVAFALISTPPGAPIRVKKNIRVCIDCHNAMKFICEIVSREIVLRDVNRFHHFRDGLCSCGDYW